MNWSLTLDVIKPTEILHPAMMLKSVCFKKSPPIPEAQEYFLYYFCSATFHVWVANLSGAHLCM